MPTNITAMKQYAGDTGEADIVRVFVQDPKLEKWLEALWESERQMLTAVNKARSARDNYYGI
jgi:hypothetical protein